MHAISCKLEAEEELESFEPDAEDELTAAEEDMEAKQRNNSRIQTAR
jgi:hypothetical protein